MKLIVGLGNPGAEYEGTRHNVGFDLVDMLAKQYDADWKNVKSRFSDFAKTSINNENVILAKPQTFMNLSGKAVLSLKTFYKIKPEDILIIQDELDLEPGTFTFSYGGSAGGHHGMESIQQVLGTTDITRLRIGIGKPKNKTAMQNWVLGKANKIDSSAIKNISHQAGEAVVDWINYGLDFARNKWNIKKKLNKKTA